VSTARIGLQAAPVAATNAPTAAAGGTLDLLTVGEPLICLTGAGRLAASPSLAKSVGGAEANVAIGLARLGLRPAMSRALAPIRSATRSCERCAARTWTCRACSARRRARRA
jgi:hypothetical protein